MPIEEKKSINYDFIFNIKNFLIFFAYLLFWKIENALNMVLNMNFKNFKLIYLLQIFYFFLIIILFSI